MSLRIYSDKFGDVIDDLRQELATSPDVNVGEWQAMRGDIPQAATIEVEDVSFAVSVPVSVLAWQRDITPNLPWAEDHFLERVGGVPLNPPPSHEWWPYNQRSNEEHLGPDRKFSHTYPERLWPKFAADAFVARDGIRYPYGDLGDVVRLLRERPGTRQAYVPLWFPEDTGAVDGQRVPCTLGYHFLARGGKVKIVYYIRSCDYFRHFRDDVYMAGRLLQWVADEVGGLTPSRLVMHISSLHVFSVERGLLGGK